MKRKLVKQGAATMMISLPSKWVKENGLEKGSEVEVEEKQNELFISTKEALKQKKELTIDINKDNKKDIKNLLTHAYRKGFNKITIKNADSDLFNDIRNTLKLLLGFEITEKERKKCIIENISEPLEQKYETMLKKVFMIIKETHETIEENFRKGELKSIKEIEEMKEQEFKFNLFCRRLLFREKSEKMLDWEFLTSLMHIQHSYFYLYKYSVENKIKTEKSMINLFGELKEYFSLLEDAYYNKNIKSIHKINDLKQKYQFGKCLFLIEKSKGKEAVVYSYLKELFRLIQLAASPILSEVIEKKI